jgi:hypothetical protein
MSSSGTDWLEVLGFGGGHDDGAIPVENVGYDEAGGLAGSVRAESNGRDTVLSRQQTPDRGRLPVSKA